MRYQSEKTFKLALHELAPILGVAICLGIAGCMVGPRYKRPDAITEPQPAIYKETPSQYKGTAGWKVAHPGDAMLRGDWWKVFKDPELNALEAQVNLNNQNIKQFFENFMAARAMVGEANSQLYPTLTGNASYSRAHSPPGLTSSSMMSALDVSWEPDLWGRIRNMIRAAQYNAQLSAADLANEQLSEQAMLAMLYFEIRGQDSLENLYDETVVEYKKALEYTRAQYETGITDKIAYVESLNALQNAEAARTNLAVARAQYEHAIAVLVGRVASNFSIPSRPLKATPPPIPVGLPSQLLERRPDIAASERTMAAANAQIGVAVAAYYPTVTLGAERGQKGTHLSNLFDAANRLWSFGPSVSETIFDAGLRRAAVQQYVSTYNADVASYRQTVLTAFQQVEDYLSQVRILSVQLGQQRAAAQSAEEQMKLETDRFKTGIDPYVDVVTAQTNLLTDQQAVINVQTQEMTGAVQLVKALGGGWDLSQLPSAHDVSFQPKGEETRVQH